MNSIHARSTALAPQCGQSTVWRRTWTRRSHLGLGDQDQQTQARGWLARVLATAGVAALASVKHSKSTLVSKGSSCCSSSRYFRLTLVEQLSINTTNVSYITTVHTHHHLPSPSPSPSSLSPKYIVTISLNHASHASSVAFLHPC